MVIAKLRMLEFYYDFLDFYINRQDYECFEMDTESLYFALSSSSLEDVVKPEKKKEFYENYHKWLPAQASPSHQGEFVSKEAKACLSIHIHAVFCNKSSTNEIQDYLN